MTGLLNSKIQTLIILYGSFITDDVIYLLYFLQLLDENSFNNINTICKGVNKAIKVTYI